MNLRTILKIGLNNIVFRYMQGDEVEPTWRGTLENVTYRFGGDLINNS